MILTENMNVENLVVNGGYFENPEYKFGANCYGVKPSPKGNEMEKQKFAFTQLTEEELKKAEYKEQLNKIEFHHLMKTVGGMSA